MRTREEQINELVDALKKPVCRPDYSVKILKMWIESHIREAEQRVRAEIGRDSERLEWLEQQPFAMLQRFDQGWTVATDQIERSCGQDTARNAIDAAREVV